MPISSQRYWFNEANIRSIAPARAGVYGLYDGNTTIYYGESLNIQDRLIEHLQGYSGRCTANAESFNVEVRSNRKARERQLLVAHKAQTGSLPRCNDRIG